MRYTAAQLSAMAGMTRQTFMKHVHNMMDEGKFEKSLQDAKGFSEADANKLSALIGFTLKQIRNVKRTAKARTVKRKR